MINLKLQSTLLVIGLFNFMPEGVRAESQHRNCGDLSVIARELIEYELSGALWQGGRSPCLSTGKFSTILPEHQTAGDARLLKPEHLVPKGTQVVILGIDRIGQSLVKVKFKVPIIDSAGTVFLNDELRFLINGPSTRDRDGCATLVQDPAVFVMREECLVKPVK